MVCHIRFGVSSGDSGAHRSTMPSTAKILEGCSQPKREVPSCIMVKQRLQGSCSSPPLSSADITSLNVVRHGAATRISQEQRCLCTLEAGT